MLSLGISATKNNYPHPNLLSSCLFSTHFRHAPISDCVMKFKGSSYGNRLHLDVQGAVDFNPEIIFGAAYSMYNGQKRRHRSQYGKKKFTCFQELAFNFYWASRINSSLTLKYFKQGETLYFIIF